MEPRNNTQISEFLLEFSEDLELQPLIYGLFLYMYLTMVFGHLLILLAIISDPHLHVPMYIFPSNLSFVDIGFTSTSIPKMLVNIQTQRKATSYPCCTAQMCFLLLFAGLDEFILAAIAYDRFMALCHPLHYRVMMGPRLFVLMVLVSCIISAMHALLQGFMVMWLTFCADLEVPHFICELNQVVYRACSDTFLNEMVIYFAAVLLAIVPLSGILYSYSKIISSNGAISSAQGRHKTFSTCASHLSVVSLFYCSALGVYLSSAATHSSHSTATASVMYIVVTPMLNPFIYSQRTKDFKRALKRLLGSERRKLPVILTLNK